MTVHSVGGASSHQPKALIEENDGPPWKKREFCQQTAFGLKRQLFPGSPVCRPTVQILNLPSLQHWANRFLKINLSLYRVPILLVLLLWRKPTHTQSNGKDTFKSHDGQLKIMTTNTTKENCAGLKKSALGRFALVRDVREGFPNGVALEL